MNRIFTLISLLILSSSLSAQVTHKYETTKGKILYAESDPGNATMKTAGTIDTLNQYQQRASSYILQGVTTGGYVFGTNQDSAGQAITVATGVHFDSVGTVSVNEVYVWVGAKSIVGGTDNIKLEVYNAGSDSLPTNLLGFGNANMAFVDSNTTGVNFVSMNGLAKFVINQGTNVVSGGFVVALNYDAIDDTVAIVCSNPDSADGQGERRAKQMLGSALGGGWVSAADVWVSGLDADPIMIPIVETTSIGVDPQPFANEHYVIHPPYPNPSSTMANFEVELKKSTHVQFTVWDATGKVLYISGKEWTPASSKSYQVDVSDLPNGNYYYTVRTDETRLSSKFLVQH